MKKIKKAFGPVGVLFYIFGVLVGLTLIGVMVWGDFEAAMFDPSLSGDAALKAFECPVMITPRDELATVSVTLANETEKPLDYLFRLHISQGYVSLMREVNSEYQVNPGESKQVHWEVNLDDRAYDRVILVNTYLFGRYQNPSRQAKCGIFVLDLPLLTGQQVTWFASLASLFGMVSGGGLWTAANWPIQEKRRNLGRLMAFLGLSVLTGLVTAFMGWWMIGVLMVLVCIFLMVASLRCLFN